MVKWNGTQQEQQTYVHKRHHNKIQILSNSFSTTYVHCSITKKRSFDTHTIHISDFNTLHNYCFNTIIRINTKHKTSGNRSTQDVAAINSFLYAIDGSGGGGAGRRRRFRPIDLCVFHFQIV